MNPVTIPPAVVRKQNAADKIQKTSKIIWCSVISAHILIVFVPGLFDWVYQAFFRPKEKPLELVVRVGLVPDMPYGNTLDIPKPDTPQQEPDHVDPLPPKPKQPDPPKPKTQDKPKPQEKPKPKPQDKPKPKPQEKPKPKPKRNKTLSVEDIKKQRENNKNRKIVTRTNEDEIKRQEKIRQDEERRQKQAQEKYKADMAARQKAFSDMAKSTNEVYGVVNAGMQGIQARTYINGLKDVIDPLFIEPAKSLLQGEKPEVPVQLTIGANGRLLSARIVRKSNIPAMNDAIEAWFSKLKGTALPKPPTGKDVSVTVTIRIR